MGSLHWFTWSPFVRFNIECQPYPTTIVFKQKNQGWRHSFTYSDLLIWRKLLSLEPKLISGKKINGLRCSSLKQSSWFSVISSLLHTFYAFTTIHLRRCNMQSYINSLKKESIKRKLLHSMMKQVTTTAEQCSLVIAGSN